MHLDDVRRDFFSLIDRCPNLDFLLLTKRPANVRRMWPGGFADGSETRGNDRHNVWLLYSASDQRSLEAGLPHLMACRDLAPVIGLSLEPLVGPVDLRTAPGVPRIDLGMCRGSFPKLDWIIIGGESGPRARPCDVAWIRSIRDQCAAAGVPCYIKQLGANAWDGKWALSGQNCDRKTRAEFAAITDPKGSNSDEWPEDLRGETGRYLIGG